LNKAIVDYIKHTRVLLTNPSTLPTPTPHPGTQDLQKMCTTHNQVYNCGHTGSEVYWKLCTRGRGNRCKAHVTHEDTDKSIPKECPTCYSNGKNNRANSRQEVKDREETRKKEESLQKEIARESEGAPEVGVARDQEIVLDIAEDEGFPSIFG